MSRARWGAADLPRWHRKGSPLKMPLDFYAMNCAVRMIGDVPARGAKLDVRGVIGTGFFIKVASETVPDVTHTYLLTANHVIEGQANVEIQVPDPRTGALSPPVAVRDWRQPFEHVDLALAPIRETARRVTIRLEDQVLPASVTVTPGAVVYYIGQFIPLDRVMARSGTIGAVDQRGLDLGEYSYTAHLVDCRSYKGFSGSPCFADSAYAELEPTPTEIPMELPPGVGPLGDLIHMVQLCGMFTHHLKGVDEDGNVSRYGVGVMVRSEEIRGALMSDELRNERAEADKAHNRAEDEGRPRLEQAGGIQRGEFERFEELTRKLVNTPKSELDEKRKDES